MNNCRVVIVGGGISGLATAYFLSRKASADNVPLQITVLEASDRFGGVLRTLRGPALSMEAGADAFDGRDPVACDLCRALGLEKDLLPVASTLGQAYISVDKKLQPFDLSFQNPGIALRGPGLRLASRLRLLCEGLVPSQKDRTDESIAFFIERRFGHGVLNEWGRPLVRGLLMGEPEKLSLHEYFPHLQKMEREYGSITRAVLNRKKKISDGIFFTVRGGLDRWVSALLKDLGSVDLKSHAEAAVLKKNKTWEISFRDGSTLAADSVCLALPAPGAARLLAEAAPQLAGELAKIRYDPLTVVNMIFGREALPGNFPCSGFIVPAREKKWPFASLKVIGETEDGKGIRLRAFLSGIFQPEVCGREDARIEKEVLRCLAGEWGVQALPSRISVERYPEGLAQYETGHGERVAGIEKQLGDLPGLFLAGNGYHGFGITDCIRSAREASDRISRGL
jgi:oxygen-dependent protoporphyrinogen oxidase